MTEMLAASYGDGKAALPDLRKPRAIISRAFGFLVVSTTPLDRTLSRPAARRDRRRRLPDSALSAEAVEATTDGDLPYPTARSESSCPYGDPTGGANPVDAHCSRSHQRVLPPVRKYPTSRPAHSSRTTGPS